MATIKIPKLGENKEVPSRVIFPKRVHNLLIKYSDAYEVSYGEKVQPEKLVPVIVEEYLRNDHGFKKYLSNNIQKDNIKSSDEKTEAKQKPITTKNTGEK
jgi:hypothetical protein